jgi:hypothetical protein
MKKSKDLDWHIKELYRKLGNQELKWEQIRNELLINEEISEEMRKSKSFGVYVSRSIGRLCKYRTLQKHNYGHRNVKYSLTEEAEAEIHGTGKMKSVVKGAGLYTPGCSYEEMKRRAWKQMVEEFQQKREPELRAMWEEGDRYFREKSKSHRK